VDAKLHLSLPVDDLAAARRFYEDGLGCRVGRVREQWIDVWFFGLQLTLQTRPDEVRPLADQGCRHFGVVLDDADTFWALVERLRAQGIEWIDEPHVHEHAELSGKVGGKLADPSGNVIEVKHYADPSALGADRD
jgi:extradiol dioxygenase family protein